ncbi:hypothetical protein KY328_04450 [Candidatus Woesearchaeota archaeon]|nr:hypothetical protein [Candidatus Woesearchaeota archaeon]
MGKGRRHKQENPLNKKKGQLKKGKQGKKAPSKNERKRAEYAKKDRVWKPYDESHRVLDFNERTFHEPKKPGKRYQVGCDYSFEIDSIEGNFAYAISTMWGEPRKIEIHIAGKDVNIGDVCRGRITNLQGDYVDAEFLEVVDTAEKITCDAGIEQVITEDEPAEKAKDEEANRRSRAHFNELKAMMLPFNVVFIPEGEVEQQSRPLNDDVYSDEVLPLEDFPVEKAKLDEGDDYVLCYSYKLRDGRALRSIVVTASDELLIAVCKTLDDAARCSIEVHRKSESGRVHYFRHTPGLLDPVPSLEAYIDCAKHVHVGPYLRGIDETADAPKLQELLEKIDAHNFKDK